MGWRCREGAPGISGEVRLSGIAPEIRRGFGILFFGGRCQPNSLRRTSSTAAAPSTITAAITAPFTS